MGDPDEFRRPQVRIPEDATPKDLIPGDPDKIDDLVLDLLAYAGAFKDGKDRLGPLRLAQWSGKGANAFRDAVDHLPKELTSAHTQFTVAASALTAYASKLRGLQTRCKPIIADAKAAYAASRAHTKKVHEYNAAVERGDENLPERPPDIDPGGGKLDTCIRLLDGLIAELDLVVASSKKKIDEAAKKAPDKPSTSDKVVQKVKNFAWAFHYGITDLGEFATPFLTLDEKGVAMELAGVFDGAEYAAKHPGEFAKQAIGWDEWTSEPERAAGRLTPSILLAMATGGAGALRNTIQASRQAAKRLAGRKEALRRGDNRDRAESDGTQNQCGPEKACENDPVDVVTGEMTMSAQDVSLPGTLPLLLQRTFVSGHSSGGWFGPTWAATLDQRLELDADGVVFVADDGMLLTYPVPRPDQEILPTRGPRWPLRWDGAAGGGMTISIPERGHTLHFARLPDVPATELPLQAITDRNDHRITLEYDDRGTPVEVTHSGGYRIAVDTDPDLQRITALRLLGVGDAEAGTTLLAYRYNEAGDLTGVINSSGQAFRFTYDDEHRITSWTDRNGTRFGYFYDTRGRVQHTVGSDKVLSGRFHYDSEARTTIYTDSLGSTTTYVHNEAAKVISRTDALGNTTYTDWGPEPGRFPQAITDPLGRTTRYFYGDDDQLLRIERPDGTSASWSYNALGLLIEVHEPDGAVWRHEYDEGGNRTHSTDPTGATTAYTYDASGNLTSVTDALGNTTHVLCNAAGLPVEVTDPLGGITAIRRGTHGRITRLTDPLGHATRQGWTIEGKPSWRIRPDGSRESWIWDAEGNLLEHTDPAGNTTRHTYTHFDLPASRTEPDGVTYTFAYDTESRLNCVTNPQGFNWTYEHDAAGRLKSETDFNGRCLTYAHDQAGQLLSRTNGAGETLRYTRDELGRVTAHHTDDGVQTTFCYDAAGRLIQATNPEAALSREHDTAGRLLAETVNGRTIRYTYDASGRRTSRTTPAGLISHWTYDAAGRPASLTTAGNRLTFTHDAAGREVSRTLGDGITLTQTWDTLDRLTSQTVAKQAEGPQALVQHRAYAYRADDHLTEIRELTTGTRRFDLDSAGRVTAVHAPGWSETYAYDSAGNLTAAEAPGHPSPGPREFTGTLIRRAGRTAYEHDAQGRMIRRTRKLLNGKKQTWTYTWNAEDRLVEALTPDGTRWAYTYDPLGRRTGKSHLGHTNTAPERVRFSWDGTRLAEQTALDNQSTAWDYIAGTHRPVSQVSHQLKDAEHTGKNTLLGFTEKIPERPYDTCVHAVITDPVGTPTELVAPSGDLAWQHRTALWGTPLATPTGTADCPLRFPGQYADTETGLNYNYYRYYDPETSRYASPDPLGLRPAPNHHAYPKNSLVWRDPLGLAPDECPKRGSLEGRRDYVVDEPGNPANTITDIDHIQDGVLWEEKSATSAQNTEKWVAKHIEKKFNSYMEARKHLSGYESAPIGFRFTEPGASTEFRSAVEARIDTLRSAHPDVDIRLEWN
ncbi:type IV secretion protein Rhs [Streptomyces albus subsp. albus]|nr:type IV secretion protein Rhs [Streptomyces albus subsp. albus]